MRREAARCDATARFNRKQGSRPRMHSSIKTTQRVKDDKAASQGRSGKLDASARCAQISAAASRRWTRRRRARSSCVWLLLRTRGEARLRRVPERLQQAQVCDDPVACGPSPCDLEAGGENPKSCALPRRRRPARWTASLVKMLCERRCWHRSRRIGRPAASAADVGASRALPGAADKGSEAREEEAATKASIGPLADTAAVPVPNPSPRQPREPLDTDAFACKTLGGTTSRPIAKPGRAGGGVRREGDQALGGSPWSLALACSHKP